jgi:hypothetical protein
MTLEDGGPMPRLANITLAIALVALATVAGAPDAVAGGPDLILHDAILITMDADTPEASAIAITGARIVAVGSDDETT